MQRLRRVKGAHCFADYVADVTEAWGAVAKGPT